MPTEHRISSLASRTERANRDRATTLLAKSPIPDEEKLAQAGLFLPRQELSKILFFHELYQKIIHQHGVIMEFGTRWGKNLVTLANLRGIYEPYNYSRRIIGFDTFAGFAQSSEKDGDDPGVAEGAFSVTEGYERYLEELMAYHESESPLNHIAKFELVKGDVTETLPAYLDRHPETLVAFAYFDLDIYKPTRACLELLRDRLPRGAILGFDELNDPKFPGETIALREVFGIPKVRIQRNRFAAMQSFVIIE